MRSHYYFNISQFVKSLNDNFKLKSFLEYLIIMRIWYGMFRSLNITGATFIAVFGFANGTHSIKDHNQRKRYLQMTFGFYFA